MEPSITHLKKRANALENSFVFLFLNDPKNSQKENIILELQTLIPQCPNLVKQAGKSHERFRKFKAESHNLVASKHQRRRW